MKIAINDDPPRYFRRRKIRSELLNMSLKLRSRVAGHPVYWQKYKSSGRKVVVHGKRDYGSAARCTVQHFESVFPLRQKAVFRAWRFVLTLTILLLLLLRH